MKCCDVEKWAVGRIPLVLRRPRLIGYVKVLTSQIGRLLTQGSRYSDDVRYRLAHTSQVCSVRSMLNDKLDGDKRRVAIVDADVSSELFMVYARAEQKAVLLGVGEYKLVPPRGYNVDRELNFVVRVPREWRGTRKATRLVALVNRGKLASMRYRIDYVQ